MAGQVGSQIKVRVGGLWLLANVRDMRLENPDGDLIVANVDFLGEGIEDPITGNLKGFRRGVTRYPVHGTRVFPVTTTDLEQIFSAKDRPHVRVGTVYPSVNVAALLFIDEMLGQHFALLGSTRTGKPAAADQNLHTNR